MKDNVNDSLIEIVNLNEESEQKYLEIAKEYDKYLPLGSIVMLKNGWKKIMIIGYSQIDTEKKDKTYDYLGCLYPEGILQSDLNILFDHNDIKRIFVIGMKDDEQKTFMINLKKVVEMENQLQEKI